MKQTILSFLLVMISVVTFAQSKKDSTIKKDTAYVPVYERYDTIKADYLYVGGVDAIVRYVEDAYVVAKGFAKKNISNQWEWVSEPEVFAILSPRKIRQFPNGKLIQILKVKR